MASAYGTLANDGVHVAPTTITKIVGPDGAVMFEQKVVGTRVLTPAIAWAATQQLMGVISGGTATRAQLPGRETAGKTGTAQNYQDAWFVGYTPQLVTAVWMGYAQGSIPMRNVHGQRAFGGTFCKPSLRFARASQPHYIWKASWSAAASAAASTGKPKPKPKPGGGGGGTTTSTPNPTSTP
jgi:membrane peptidoglycan carboxypeptidase